MYRAGEVVSGQVTKLVPFGAFVRVGEGIEGLVHISELANEHVESPDQVVQVGQQVRVKVVDVDVPRRRISLSIKRVDGTEITAEPEIEAEVEPEVEGDAEPQAAVQAEQAVPDQPAAEPAVPDEAAEASADEVAPEPAPTAEALEAPAPPEAPAPADVPAAEAPAPAEEEDVSLESILEDLKRREGRTE
jgi:small subunit ribosomal protein S1